MLSFLLSPSLVPLLAVLTSLSHHFYYLCESGSGGGSGGDSGGVSEGEGDSKGDSSILVKAPLLAVMSVEN